MGVKNGGDEYKLHDVFFYSIWAFFSDFAGKGILRHAHTSTTHNTHARTHTRMHAQIHIILNTLNI